MTGRAKKWNEIAPRDNSQDLSQNLRIQHQEYFQTILESDLFDVEYYMSENPETQESESHPLSHYMFEGVAKGRDPSPLFSTNYYLAQNEDVSKSGLNPLLHYILFGKKEGRVPLQSPTRELNFENEDSSFQVVPKYKKEIHETINFHFPMVSVIIPCKNRTDLLLIAISSVLNQTHTKFEIILVDDHSDLSLTLFINENISDTRIRFFDNKGHGPCSARNLGIDEARGEYIAFLDSDNQWLPNFLKDSLKALRVSGSDAVYSNLQVFNDENELQYVIEKDYSFSDLRWLNYIDLNAFVHRKFENKNYRFSEDIKRLNDWDYILRIAKECKISHANFDQMKYLQSNKISQISNTESISYLNVVRNSHFLDWEEITRNINQREVGLISIIILHHGQAKLTHDCLTSIFTRTHNINFEVILIDNQNDLDSEFLTNYWKNFSTQIKVFSKNENLNFAFGSNYGFSNSRGELVVFLNNDVLVTHDWLSSLSENITEDGVIGVQPKLLYPDGRIQNIGNVFSENSFVPYPIYRELRGDIALSTKPRFFAAITGACLMLRAKDFAKVSGFDPQFINGMEDTDLCLRLGLGKKLFKVVPDAIVIHHESQSPNRSLNIHENRIVFLNRYNNWNLANDQEYYSEDACVNTQIQVTPCCDAEHALGTVQPKYNFGGYTEIDKIRHEMFSGYEFAIRIGCPSVAASQHWGDYHFAVALAKAFARKGIRARIDFLDNWDNQSSSDINLVLRGLSEFEPVNSAWNILWVISHPELVSERELSFYDVVFLASRSYPESSNFSRLKNLKYLPQATDTSRFFPRPINPAYVSNAIYVANSRKIDRTAARFAKELGIEIEVYGQHWEGLLPDDWIRKESIANSELPNYYGNSGVVINDHWASQIEYGIASNRLFDVLACNGKFLTDNSESIPADLKPFVVGYADLASFDRGIKILLNNVEQIHNDLGESAHAVVARNHSFDNRVEEILAEIQIISKNDY
jgi:GT2 family glycosyltransferase